MGFFGQKPLKRRQQQWRRQQQQLLLVSVPLCKVWGHPTIGRITFVDISARGEADFKRHR